MIDIRPAEGRAADAVGLLAGFVGGRPAARGRKATAVKILRSRG